MLDQYFRNAGVQERINANPIRQEIAQLVHYLADRGYARQTVRTYVWAAEHFGAWLGTSDRRLRRVDRPAVVEFLREHLPGCCCPRPATKLLKSTRPGLMLLLRAIGEIPKPKRSQSRFAELLAPYVEHLRVNGGLAEKTRDTHAYYACEFLDSRFPNGPIRLGDILPHDVALFVADYAAVRKRSTARTAASSLRSFLRFLQMRGLCDESLILAVPTIRRWKLSSLPKTMTEEQLVQFLGSFDCSTATGSRDYAMALSMTHLGLRVSEVCAIELDHVNWRDGTVRIFSPKGAPHT